MQLRHHSVLTTRPWPIYQKHMDTNHMVSDTRHSSQPIMGRNDSILGFLHLALVYEYYFCKEETWEHVYVHWQRGKFKLWANCFMSLLPLTNHRPNRLRGTSPNHRPIHQNRLALSLWYQTPGTTVTSRLMLHFLIWNLQSLSHTHTDVYSLRVSNGAMVIKPDGASDVDRA